MTPTFKQSVYVFCQELVQEKISAEKAAMDETQAMGNAASRSASGDKFDSEVADNHRETEKHTIQLANWLRLRETLAQIKADETHTSAHLGSLVQTNTATYFLSVGLGKIVVDGSPVFALSLDSPIAQQLLGKAAGESFSFRGKSQQVLTVF